MNQRRIPVWIMAVALLLFAIGFLLSLFTLDSPRSFWGRDFGPKPKIVQGQWPPGKYGLLADGKCPTGFRKVSGGLFGISTYRGNQVYLKSAQFGESSIGLHNLGRSFDINQPGHHGDITLVTCMKN